MRRRVLLLGPDGQLGHEVLRAHAQSPSSLDLIPLPRDKLDVAAGGAVRRRPEGAAAGGEVEGPAERAIERALGDLEFDVLVNCAAFTRVDEAEGNPTIAFAVNAHAVRAMAHACAAKRARLLHVGTDYVFGGDAARRHPLREDDPVAPVNVYGTSKAMGETLAGLACDDVVILRTASLFGVAGVGGRGGNFVETVIRAGRESAALRVVDDQTMSPTAAADVAQVVMRMLEDECPPGLYHVVNSGSATWFEFAREIVRRSGVAAAVTPCSTEDYPTRAARPRYSVLDNTRVSTNLWPMPAWQDALERYLRGRGHRGE